MSSRSAELWPMLFLAIIISLFGLAKFYYNPGIGVGALDGEYYYQIARHIRDGDGLSTSVSLYYIGLETLPHLINQSPVWSMTLGYLSRIWDLHTLAHTIPEILFLIDLVLLFILTNTAAERLGLASENSIFFNKFIRPGHILVLIFGLSRPFFKFTSLPYTEALAFFFALTSIILCDRAATRESIAYAILAGLTATLAFLSRAQFIGFLFAIPLSLAVPLLLRRKFPSLAVYAMLAVVVCLMPWFQFLSSWLPEITFQSFLGMGSFKGSGDIPVFSNKVATEGPVAWLFDRLSGLRTSFDIFDDNSYITAFGPSAYLVLLSFFVMLIAKINWRLWWERLSSPESTILTACFLIGILALIPVHNSHFNWFKEWLFGHRHGLPLIFILILSTNYLLLSKNRIVSLLASIIIGTSLATQVPWAYQQIVEHREPRRPRPETLALSAWLDSKSPHITSVTTLAQTLSTHSRSNFHWTACSGSGSTTRAILRYTSAEYVIVFPNDKKCSFIKDLGEVLHLEAVFGNGWHEIQVFRYLPDHETET